MTPWILRALDLAVALMEDLDEQLIAGGGISKFQGGLTAKFACHYKVFHGFSLGKYCCRGLSIQ